MSLSSDLISQFVKATNDKESKSKETIVYGTAKVDEDNGTKRVQIDGSTIFTPVSSTVDVKNGDRVIVMIKNHAATVTGNLTSPSARVERVQIVETSLSEKVSTEDLEAQIATINELKADKATVNELSAEVVRVGNLISDQVTTEELNAEVAKITELLANKVETSELEAELADIDVLLSEKANISDLNAEFASINSALILKLDASVAEITYATIADLDVATGRISTLESGVADIDELIFGSASGTTIQTSFANAVIAQLGNAQIKSAMIDNISADKITAGDIITNNVRVMSEDGKLLISDETIQISDSTRVRVQIGKDASNDYSINIWDENGNLMFSKGGITDSAIKEAIIRNDMVSDTANISAHKLDIDSLFEEINDSSNTIKSTKVYLDDRGQTLNVAFTSITTDISELGETVTSQGTEILTLQGQISSKIWEQDITDAVNDIKVGGRNYILDSEAEKTGNVNTYPIYNFVDSTLSDLLGKEITISFEAKADDTDGTHDIDVYLRSYTGVIGGSRSPIYTLGTEYIRYSYTFTLTESMLDAIQVRVRGNQYVGENSDMNPTGGNFFIRRMKLEAGNVATDWTPAPEDMETDISTLSSKYSTIEQTVDTISATVSAHTTEIAEKADSSTVTAVTTRVTTLEQNLEGFKSTVSSTYATKNSVSTLDSRVTATESSITQLSNRITSNVTDISELGTRMSTVEQTADSLTVKLSSLDIGGRNYILKSAGEQSSNATIMYNFVDGILQSLIGKTLTVSFKAKADDTDNTHNIDVYLRSDAIITATQSSKIVIDGEYKVYKYSFVLTQAAADIAVNLCFRGNPYVSGGNSGSFYIKEVKMEVGEHATDWSAAPEDIDADILAASKKATNYLSFSSSGLVVGDMTATTLGKNVLIDSDSVDIRNGDVVLASFGANKVILGRNSEDSVIDLCNGAGRISANTSEAATSYPYRNAILIDSQEIETESVRFVASTSNGYGSTSTPTIQRRTELYMQRSTSSSESCARLKAEHKTTSSGAYTSSGISAMTYDSASSTRALIFANDSANSTYNQINVYPTKTTMNKNLVLNGTTFTGANKVLWSGVYYMSDSQTATLSEAISAQANGVVLVWSYYTDGAADNSNFQMTYIPKHFITLHPGKGVAVVMTNGTMNVMASKYVYVSDTSIKGYAGNDDAATAKDSGVTSTSKNFVLRYVVGV